MKEKTPALLGNSRRHRWPACGGAVSIAFLLAAVINCSRREPTPSLEATGPSILLITVDTLRADHVGCYGAHKVKTPAIDSLAAQGIRFDDALSQVPLTLPSHTVILSGTYPMWNGVRDFTRASLRPDLGLIAEAFKRHGYRTAAFISSHVLDSFWGLSRGFDTYDERFEPAASNTKKPIFVQRRAAETVSHLLAWYQTEDAGGKKASPFFVWLHLYDPHSPYDPPEPYHTLYAGHLYDGEIAYDDTQLGLLFDGLRRNGIYDSTLIVLLSDHGESLGEHGEDEHGFFIYRSTIHVPLIIKLPRGTASDAKPRVIADPVGTIDVAPTLLELAHIQDPISSQFQGTSLVSLALGKGPGSQRPVYTESYYSRDSFGWSSLRSVTNARYQYILAPRFELYDVIHDPAEMHHVQRSADAMVLRDQLLDIERRYTSQTSASTPASPLPTETVERLKSLGYVAYSAPVNTTDEKDLPDPKDRVQFIRAYLRSQELSSARQFDRSDVVLESLRDKEPNLYLIPFALGQNAQKEHRLADAERDFLACLKRNPTFDQAIMGLAQVALGQGKIDDARTWIELAISQDPHSYVAYFALGTIEKSRGRVEEAQRNFEKAIALKPDYWAALQGLGMTFVETQHYAEALKPLEAAASLGSNDPELFNTLGGAYLNTMQPQKAIRSFRKALLLNNGFVPARLGLALAYLKAGDRASAISEYRNMCTHDDKLCRQYQSTFQ